MTLPNAWDVRNFSDDDLRPLPEGGDPVRLCRECLMRQVGRDDYGFIPSSIAATVWGSTRCSLCEQVSEELAPFSTMPSRRGGNT